MTIYELRIYGRQHIGCQFQSLHSAYRAAIKKFKDELLRESPFARTIDHAEIFKLKLDGKSHEFNAIDRFRVEPFDALMHY